MTTVFKLPVPYVSQLGPGADTHRNDCGAACLMMLLKAYGLSNISVDDLYLKANIEFDEYLDDVTLRRAAAKFNLYLTNQTITSHAQVIDLLTFDLPIIALINYGVLKIHGYVTSDKRFTGAHFVVIIGYKPDYYIIHDPLLRWSTETGTDVSIVAFMNAWYANNLQGNPPHFALVPQIQLGENLVAKDKFDNTALYQVRVISDIGLYIRSEPYIDDETLTGKAAPTGAVYYIYHIVSNAYGYWGAIRPDKTEWICMYRLGHPYVKRL